VIEVVLHGFGNKSITAAVVEPVGLKAYWSAIDEDIGCSWRAG